MIGSIALITLNAACGSSDGMSLDSSNQVIEGDAASDPGDTVTADDTSAKDGDSSAPTEDMSPATGDTGESSTAPAVGIASLPPLPDPAPALPCDGSTVLCVDSGASADAADGTVSQPFASVADALNAASAGTAIQVASGTYAESVVIAGVEGLSLIGGFAAGGDFSARDSQANATVLHGTSETSVISITASTGIHIEGFRLTGGGARPTRTGGTAVACTSTLSRPTWRSSATASTRTRSTTATVIRARPRAAASRTTATASRSSAT